MPLSQNQRAAISKYIDRDIAPTKKKIPREEWFQGVFSCVSNPELRRHLGDAYYQARYVERTREAIRPSASADEGFIRFQIFQYASIYEALIDHYLDLCRDHPSYIDLTKRAVFKPNQGFAKNVTLTVQGANGEVDALFTCRRAEVTTDLREVAFPMRLNIAKSFNIVLEAQCQLIQELYTQRNNIHLLRAATQQFTPEDSITEAAFRGILDFMNNLRNWEIPPSK